jgi:uncharacterized protein (TIGR02246 family)
MLPLAMSASPIPLPPISDEQAIRNLMESWMRSVASGDLATVLTLMSDDVVFLVAGQPPVQGKQAFASAFQALLPVVRIDTTSDTQEIQVHGDIAWCWNHLNVTVTPRGGGQPSRRTGYTLSVLRREPAGNWVVIRDANLLTAG